MIIPLISAQPFKNRILHLQTVASKDLWLSGCVRVVFFFIADLGGGPDLIPSDLRDSNCPGKSGGMAK